MKRLYPCLLIAVGVLLFHSVLFKGFILDDKSQIITNTAIHSLTAIPSFFFSSLHYGETVTALTGFTFRPVTFTAYTLLYAIGQGTPFAFHAFLLLLYIANCVLVFFLFLRFTRPLIAFLLALLFLIHPANQEIATYIADIQDALYFFFGVSALLIITSKRAFNKKIVISCIFLLLACLSKETGILFIFAAGLYIFMTERKNHWQAMLIYGLLLSGYFLLRINAGHSAFLTIDVPHFSTVQAPGLYNQLLLIPKMLAYYLTALVMPLPALPTDYLAKTDLLVSSLSFLFVCLTYIGILMLGKTIKSKALSSYVFFFCLFLLSALFHSQLLPLDVLVSKRWLYVQLFAFFAMVSVVLEVHFTQLEKCRLPFLLFYTIFAIILLAETLLMLNYY